MITAADRLVLAVATLHPTQRLIVECVAASPVAVSCPQIASSIGVPRYRVHKSMVGLMGKRILTRSLPRSGKEGGQPYFYRLSDGVNDVLGRIPRDSCVPCHGSVRAASNVLAVVRELVADEVWPSRLLVGREAGVTPGIAGRWMGRFRRWGLFPDTKLHCHHIGPLKMYSSIAPGVHRTRKPRVRRILPYEPRVHKDHS